MAKAYWVVSYRSISDPAAREAYTKLAIPAVLASGGRFLAVFGDRIGRKEILERVGAGPEGCAIEQKWSSAPKLT